jgi:propanol-preferring alcohol dehydrogenase
LGRWYNWTREPSKETGMPLMRRALLRRVGESLEIGTAPVPEPGPGEILIRVVACGVCHSDLHAVDGDWGEPPKMPLIPGHEVTGHVVAHGPGVDRPALGAAVGVPWMAGACGRCAWCQAGMETICPEGGATGFNCDGGYAEYMVARADFVGVIPDGVDLVRIAPILCAGVTTYRGLRRSEARAGEFVAIIGAGGLGHVAVQYARAMGFRPIVLDVDPAKLDLARRLGAEAAVEAGPDAAGTVMTLTGGGAAAAIVTAPAPAAFEQSLALIRPGGTAVFIGLPGGQRAWRSKRIRVSPIWISSPGYSGCSRTGCPLTRVPLVEPQSMSVKTPPTSRTSAWLRLALASLSTTSWSARRPMLVTGRLSSTVRRGWPSTTSTPPGTTTLDRRTVATATSGTEAGFRSRRGSWARIRPSRSRSCGPGSRPSSSTRTRRPSW